MIDRTSLSLCPVMLAISASVHPAIARRVTAVPRRSWNVRPTIPAAAHALPHEVRNPSDVHGLPWELSSTLSCALLPTFAASRAAFSGAPTGMTTRTGLLRLPDLRLRMLLDWEDTEVDGL